MFRDCEPISCSIGERRFLDNSWRDECFLRLFRWRETGCGIAEHGAMVDAEGFNPALLAEGEADEKTELDQLWDRKKSVQFFPERVVGDV